jgi:DnaJ-class molecular chaperone
MNNDNGFDRAQAQYDAQMPPEDNRIECPDCEETGKVDGEVCPRCGGDGYIDDTNKAEAYEEWMERKADEARDEQAIEHGKIGSDTDKFLGNKEI